MSIPVAVQLYSVRNDCQQDLFGVLKQVADMGYDGVEFAGYYGHPPSEIRKALDDLGLKAEGTHTPITDFDDDKLPATVQTHRTLGCTFAIVPWIPEEMRNSEKACLATAAKMTEISRKLEAQGLRTGFHAHEGDMRPLAGGPSAWDLLAGHTPSSFIMQYDTANGMAGGADPVRPILDWPSRSVSVHLKGYNEGHGALVGEPTIPWEDVLRACETVGGTQWYVVEHEEEGPLSPLDSIRQCRENLRKMGR
jgi:sugar phosphate isomerase/epimerase